MYLMTLILLSLQFCCGPLKAFITTLASSCRAQRWKRLYRWCQHRRPEQERLVLPRRHTGYGRAEVLGCQRCFFPVRPGLSDAETLILGSLGNVLNRFTGSTRAQAEGQRDQYAIANPTWLASQYQANFSGMIQLSGFGAPVYQRYDEIDGHWANADVYRATIVNRWGPFTEVMGVKQDPMRSSCRCGGRKRLYRTGVSRL